MFIALKTPNVAVHMCKRGRPSYVKSSIAYLPSKHFPLNRTFCSNRNFSIDSFDEKLISLETALHFKIFFGTRAENVHTVNVLYFRSLVVCLKSLDKQCRPRSDCFFKTQTASSRLLPTKQSNLTGSSRQRKWLFADALMMALLQWYLDPTSFGPPLTILSGAAH